MTLFGHADRAVGAVNFVSDIPFVPAFARFRGDEREGCSARVPCSIVKQRGTLSSVGGRQKEISPCFGFGPGDRPHSSLITPPSLRGGWRADKAHGLDRQAGDGTACGRAWA